MGKISGHTEGKGETMGVGNGKHSPSRMGYGMGETLMERGRDPWALGKGTGEAPLDHNGNKSDSWAWEGN